jgi:hypothetical protein
MQRRLRLKYPMDCHCDVVKGMEGFRFNRHRQIQWITRQATLQSFNSHERLKSIEVEGPVTRLALHRGYFKYEFLEKRGHHETWDATVSKNVQPSRSILQAHFWNHSSIVCDHCDRADDHALRGSTSCLSCLTNFVCDPCATTVGGSLPNL